jgi:hypothetical protein
MAHINWPQGKQWNGPGKMVRALGMTFIILLSSLSVPAYAATVWEDYQGTQFVFGTSNQDKPGPAYDNNTGSAATNRSNLRTIAADITNATRTGTGTNIDFAATSGTLCNTSNATAGAGYDAAGTGPACQADAQGRVVYALVKFPASGTYTFSAAHDDEVDLDLSTDYTNTSYRTAAYNMPVGDAAAWTANDTTYETLAGVFSTPTANACILMRLYWSNNGGITFLRLRWTRPDSVSEVVPAAQLFDPGDPASSAGCTGSISSNNTSIVLNKAVGASGRAAAADQFTVTVAQNSNNAFVSGATTAGSGTGQQASTGSSIITNGTVYKLTDAMAAGSSSTLTAAYNPVIDCTRGGSPYTPTVVSTGVWTVVTSAANQQIICTMTNSRKSAFLRFSKTWVNAAVGNSVNLPATSGFFTNSSLFASTANTANETDTSPTSTIYVGETGTLAGESFTIGTASAYASVIGCSAGTLSGTDGQAANTLTVPVAAAGTTITCTYTNTYRPPLGFTKSVVTYSDPFNNLSNPKSIPGGYVNYTLLINSPSAYTVTNNSLVITDAVPAGLKLYVGDYGGAGSGPVSFSQGAPSSTLTYTFTSLASATDDIEFSNDGGATWAYIPVPDINGIDATVTHVRIKPKGSMAASTSFSVLFRCRIV